MLYISLVIDHCYRSSLDRRHLSLSRTRYDPYNLFGLLRSFESFFFTKKSQRFTPRQPFPLWCCVFVCKAAVCLDVHLFCVSMSIVLKQNLIWLDTYSLNLNNIHHSYEIETCYTIVKACILSCIIC